MIKKGKFLIYIFEKILQVQMQVEPNEQCIRDELILVLAASQKELSSFICHLLLLSGISSQMNGSFVQGG